MAGFTIVGWVVVWFVPFGFVAELAVELVAGRLAAFVETCAAAFASLAEWAVWRRA
jgi:hypothetical protein